MTPKVLPRRLALATSNREYPGSWPLDSPLGTDGVDAPGALHMQQPQSIAELGEAGLDLFPSSRRIQVGVYDDAGHAESGQHPEAGGVWERNQLRIDVVREGRPDAAVAVDRLLPMRGRVQHERRLAVGADEEVPLTDRDFGDHKRFRLTIEPAVDCRRIDALADDAQRHRRKLCDQESGAENGEG